MWRKCDLHIHSGSDDRSQPRLSADEILTASASANLDVIAVADHDEVTLVADVVAKAPEAGVEIIPAVELTTDRGHILCYVPGAGGAEVLESLINRCGARPGGTVELDELLRILKDDSTRSGRPYRHAVITVAAHVNEPGSLIGTQEVGTFAGRLDRVLQLHAVEVNEAGVRAEWLRSGIGSSGRHLPILQSSDAHSTATIGSRSTWIWLPDCSRDSVLQALATFDTSLVHDGERPMSARQHIRSLTIAGGWHGGLHIDFTSRVNAVIGPPSIGKSLVVDVLRFLFCDDCEIPEVHDLTTRRMERHLPQGSVVSAVVEKDGVTYEIRREVGGHAVPELPFRPIIFSQTELLRRAMEASPSIALIDVHAVDMEGLYGRLDEATSGVEAKLDEVLEIAIRIQGLVEIVENPVDGLTAVEAQIRSLGVAEDLARRSQSIEAVLSWRATTTSVIEGLEVPQVNLEPLPPVPELPDEDLEFLQAAPRAALMARISRLREELSHLTAVFQADATAMLGAEEPLHEARSVADRQITEAGGTGATDLISTLMRLRQRKVALDAQTSEIREQRDRLATALAKLRTQLQIADGASTAIADARREACRRINESLGAFFCKVDQNDTSGRIEAIRSLRTGLHAGTLDAYCETLSPLEVVERVVQDVASGAEATQDRLTSADPGERIVAHLLGRKDWQCLKTLMTARIEERLEIGYIGEDGPPKPFSELTEGLRALAIKEVSFVASDRPVITDQPEDSVPTRSVYDELVPIFSRQREQRQFIVVSHDANIVVGGDADQVSVLSQGAAISGNLFDPQISRNALNHLEGGEEAFERRQQRYEALAFAPFSNA